jgi:hypothetical protein
MQRNAWNITNWRRNKDGQPVELGRGAMGVTYKAFDVNLRCPVTLKVISEKRSTSICGAR